jgi:hypothetical protein
VQAVGENAFKYALRNVVEIVVGKGASVLSRDLSDHGMDKSMVHRNYGHRVAVARGFAGTVGFHRKKAVAPIVMV